MPKSSSSAGNPSGYDGEKSPIISGGLGGTDGVVNPPIAAESGDSANIEDIAAGAVSGIAGMQTENETTNPNGNGNKDEDDKKAPIGIPDTTGDNEESTINGSSTVDFESALKWAEEQQAKQWEREDAIRKETQEREDSAYQRAVADMRKAGINPNLLNVNPAESGGGITNATGINDTVYQAELEKYITQLEQDFNEYFTGSENEKDRMMQGISTIIMLVSLMAKFGKK